MSEAARITRLGKLWAENEALFIRAGILRSHEEMLAMEAEKSISDLSYGVHSVRRSTFTPDQIERLKALRDDLTTIIEREER